MAINKRLRFFVLERDGFRCTYCNADDKPLEVDHVIPRSLGGLDIASNLRASCYDCNRGKGATPLSAEATKSLTAKEVRDKMRELRPIKRRQLTTTSLVSSPVSQQKNYFRDLGGLLGRGHDLITATKRLIEKNPADKAAITEASLKHSQRLIAQA